jgi:hypothetical protein
MLVYRYMSLNHGLDAIQKRLLRVGRLAELNDPYDCLPLILNHPNLATREHLGDGFETGMLEVFSTQFGLLSYSATPLDPVVWSHYADKHHGLAFEFDYPDTHANQLIKVTYSEERKVLDYTTIAEKMKEFPSDPLRKIIEDAFTTKAMSWDYEQEYRQFVMLNKCQPLGEHYFQDMPAEHLKSVIVGARSSMRKGDVERSIKSAQFPNPVTVIQAQRNRSRYEIVLGEATSVSL